MFDQHPGLTVFLRHIRGGAEGEQLVFMLQLLYKGTIKRLSAEL